MLLLTILANGDIVDASTGEVLAGACPDCHGEGVVQFNRSRDPQCVEDAVCDRCHGSGELEEAL